MAKKEKILSPLVEAVLSLDARFAELHRLGEKIESMTLKSEFEVEQTRKLLMHFAECGEGISKDVIKLSEQLNAARANAETVAEKVGARAEELQAKSGTQQEVWDRFQKLNDKVVKLNTAIANLRTKEDPKELLLDLTLFESEFGVLIEEAQGLRHEAQGLKMGTLESNADSLAQTLQAAQKKIRELH